MKICWDNLEGIYLTKNGIFIKGFNSYVEKEKCIECGESYLTPKTRQSDFCDRSCALKRRKFSEETKQKMVRAWKKRGPVSKETRQKMSAVRKGLLIGERNGMYKKIHSDEMKRKMSRRMKGNKYRLGISHSEEVKRHLSIINRGELNGNWQGGISCEPYCYEWSFKDFKDMIKERDGNKCMNPDCLGNSCMLVIHHIDYNKKNCDPENLITLCNSCNSRANGNREWHESWYKAIVNRRYCNGYPYNQFSL